MALSRNDGKNRRATRKSYPFTISRDGSRVVTDRETGTVLGSLAPYGSRWDYNSDLVAVSRPIGYETVTDAADALYRAWKNGSK
jgi:hypothetical protein